MSNLEKKWGNFRHKRKLMKCIGIVLLKNLNYQSPKKWIKTLWDTVSRSVKKVGPIWILLLIFFEKSKIKVFKKKNYEIM